MSAYFISIIFAAVVLLGAILISIIIPFEPGVNPKDPRKRRVWFWILALVNPVFFYIMAIFAFSPASKRELEKWLDAVPLAIVIGFLSYILLGYILSKIFKHGKLGNWF